MDNEEEFLILMSNIRSNIAVIAMSTFGLAILFGLFVIVIVLMV